MDFGMLPPEVNSGKMYAGPGSGPMLAAAAAWDQLAAELRSAAASYGSVLSGLTSTPWQGPASETMTAAAAPYIAWMSTTAAQAEQAANQAKAAAAAYETAFAMTVPPPVVAANRSLLMTLIATNLLGQNTPAIAATEADYAEMWGQDAAAMYAYAGSSAAASMLTPFTPPQATTNSAGLAGQTATLPQTIMSNGPQLMSAVPQALQGLASVSAAADPPSSDALAGLLTALVIPLTAADIPIATASATASTTSASASFTSVGTTYRGFLINADRDYAQGNGPYTGYGPGAAMVPQWIVGGPDALTEASSPAPPAVAAGLGQGTTVGRLSVPSGWASAAPTFRPVAYALPLTGADAAPDIVTGSSSNLFGDMALAGMAGRAIGSTALLGRGDQRIRTVSSEQRRQPLTAHSAPVTEIVAELRELATRANSLLAKLQDSGLMTDQDVAKQKRCFPG